MHLNNAAQKIKEHETSKIASLSLFPLSVSWLDFACPPPHHATAFLALLRTN